VATASTREYQQTTGGIAGIIGIMPRRRPKDPTLDLFATPATARTTDRSDDAQSAASQPRHLLPKDLAGALARMGDAEIDSLLKAVTTEARRRGRLAPHQPGEETSADARSHRGRVTADAGAALLTTGKLNAVRAAFKAGVRPSAIARQFGISQSDVRKALGAEGKKSRR
jgi:hypothetical protein